MIREEAVEISRSTETVPNRQIVVRVGLGARGYDICIGEGLLGRAGASIATLADGIRVAIVTDQNVVDHHCDTLKSSLTMAGIDACVITIPAGEASKSQEVLHVVTNQILDARLERGDAVVALGGGVVGDLAGFAAGIVRRGMSLVQMPTSLLAQIDSSVGGKTGINTSQGKNLLGVFHQPKLVLADTETLDTLPVREFRAGYAEMVKYGLIDRPDFFSWLEENWQEIFSGGMARITAIAESCRSKAAVVERDEREDGERALLNLGHTFGHALEAATLFDGRRLVHGEGVAIGLVLAHRFSARLNQASMDDAQRVERHLRRVGLPTSLADIDGSLPPAERLLEFIMQDKKVSRGALTFILTRGIGKSYVAKDVPASQVLAFLQESCPT